MFWQKAYNYVDREWKEGLLTSLLHKFCLQPVNMNYDIMAKPTMKIMQLDGQVCLVGNWHLSFKQMTI